MKEKLKKIWMFSGRAMNMLMSLIAILLFSSRRTAKKVRKLNDKKNAGKKAFVLGNGPSLNKVLATSTLYEELKNSSIIVTNRFAICDGFFSLRPNYYILLDPAFFNEETILGDPSIQNMYEALNRIDWPMSLFISYHANDIVLAKYLHNNNIKIIRYNDTTIVGSDGFQNYMYRHCLGIPSSRNIVIPAIMMMINLGFGSIYLYGVEFSWTKNIDVDPNNNKAFLNNSHFYNSKDVLHYDKGWFKWYLEAIVEMLTGLEKVETFAKSRDVKIINRTKGSFIDVFEYENPDNLVKV